MINRGKFFAGIRSAPFSGAMTQAQVNGTDALLDAFDRVTPQIDLRWEAYGLATTYHETAHSMLPIEEYGKGRGHAYGQPAGKWHKVYDGRGDVQLTWQKNYAHATTELRRLGVIGDSIDLEREPALAMRPDIAAAILIHGMTEGWFTGHKFADYFNDHNTDWVRARKIINGLDKADTIANYARQFHGALVAATKA
jgi:putative chitinase